jgi:hypothetical protein
MPTYAVVLKPTAVCLAKMFEALAKLGAAIFL